MSEIKISNTALREALAELVAVEDEPLPCGHPAELLLHSAETGAPLYCELCDDKSGRRDAEQREEELSAKVRQLEEQVRDLKANTARYLRLRNGPASPSGLTVPEGWRAAVATAYGYLWHVNNEPGTPHQYAPERAAYEARKALRELLTHEQRGEAINAVRATVLAAPSP